MIIGAALVIAALSLFLWNQREARRADNAVKTILPAVAQAAEDGEHGSADAGMTVKEIDGNLYIGYVTIPALGLSLPVMSDWSYPQLKIAPCRYYGSVPTGDMVIAAHNYRSHFGRIKDLATGDTVYFTDMDGVTHSYAVAEIDTLSPTAIEDMTSSGYPLTLFTCTYGGASRVTVRCVASNGK